MSELKTTEAPVKLTQGAVEEFKRLMNEKGHSADMGVRIGVKGGGCAGFSYILGIDSKKEQDEEFEISGLRVFMEKSHFIYLGGIEIDYVNGLNNRGFTFNNPNAESTCGCGSSFG